MIPPEDPSPTPDPPEFPRYRWEWLLLAAVGWVVGMWQYPELGAIGGPVVGAIALVAGASLERRGFRELGPLTVAPWFTAIGLALGGIIGWQFAPTWWDGLLATLAVGVTFAGLGILLGAAFTAARWIRRLVSPRDEDRIPPNLADLP